MEQWKKQKLANSKSVESKDKAKCRKWNLNLILENVKKKKSEKLWISGFRCCTVGRDLFFGVFNFCVVYIIEFH